MVGNWIGECLHFVGSWQLKILKELHNPFKETSVLSIHKEWNMDGLLGLEYVLPDIRIMCNIYLQLEDMFHSQCIEYRRISTSTGVILPFQPEIQLHNMPILFGQGSHKGLYIEDKLFLI